MSERAVGFSTPIFPEQASSFAGQVDALFFALVGISLFFGTLIVALIIGFAIRYKRRSADEVGKEIHGSMLLELTWTIIPLIIALGIFVWGTAVYFHLSRPPDDSMTVHVVAKRWMWKLQHMNGRREIDELHVPVGRPVMLKMTSEDVIHSFYVPAFRVKADVLPGRYTSLWFKPTKPGRYHLFCAEYCGAEHSAMIGSVIVMDPAAFQTWLAGGPEEASMASAGEKLFRNLGCITCHNPDSQGRGPTLDKVYGSEVRLVGGAKATADEAYLRESILSPGVKVVDGYQPVMPTFRGLITEEGILQVIEYIKSLGAEPGTEAAPAGGKAEAAGTAREAGK